MKNIENIKYFIFILAILSVSYKVSGEKDNIKIYDDLSTYVKIDEDLNGWIETGCYYEETYFKRINSWISDKPKEVKSGFVFIEFFDYDQKNSSHPYGHYEEMTIKHFSMEPLVVQEIFEFEGYKLNYTISFFDSTGTNDWINCTNKLFEKSWTDITPDEASHIGEPFQSRVKALYNSLENFSRFNKKPLDSILRKEYNNYWTDVGVMGKIENPGFPIYQYLDQEKLKRLNRFLENH